jgi:hypothetical protein
MFGSKLRPLVGLALLLCALSTLLPYTWLVGPPRDLFWRYWLTLLLAPLLVLYWIDSPTCPKRPILGCCLAYWTLVSCLTNLQVYSPSSTQFCLAYHSRAGRAYNVFLVGPAVSGCEAVTPADVSFNPPESAYVASGWSSLNDFNVVIRPGWNWTLMAVRCRGRRFPSCDRVPESNNSIPADWRATVPEVPHQPLWVVYFVLVSHVLVFLGVQLLLRRRGTCLRRAPEPEPEPLLSAA